VSPLIFFPPSGKLPSAFLTARVLVFLMTVRPHATLDNRNLLSSIVEATRDHFFFSFFTSFPPCYDIVLL